MSEWIMTIQGILVGILRVLNKISDPRKFMAKKF